MKYFKNVCGKCEKSLGNVEKTLKETEKSLKKCEVLENF